MEERYLHDRQGEDVRPLPGRGFWASGTELSERVSDACPLGTRTCLIAAAGRAKTPLYTVDMGGIDGLYDVLYGNLLPRTEAHTALLTDTFGESETEVARPVGRCAAVLAEAVALEVLDGHARGATPEQAAAILGDELSRRLGALRARMALDDPTLSEAEIYAISMAVCRLNTVDEGMYTVDILSTGAYRLYILDAYGMRPLWEGEDAPFIPGQTEAPACAQVSLIHPEPFVLLLLSSGAVHMGGGSALPPATPERLFPAMGKSGGSAKEPTGQVWRHRMRLEEAFLHLLIACLWEQEMGERASRYFAGHLAPEESAAGALMLRAEEGGFEELCELWHNRLRRVEDLLTLLPDAYHPLTAPAVPSRYDTEVAFLTERMADMPALADAAADVVYITALEALRTRFGSGAPGKTDADRASADAGAEETRPVLDTLLGTADACITDLRHLEASELEETYAVYRAEDLPDLAQIDRNHAAIDETLSAHWVTWRPICQTALRAGGIATPDAASPKGRATLAYRAARDRDHAALLCLNTRIGEKLVARRQAMQAIEDILASATQTLRTEGTDWLGGLGGDANAMAWVSHITTELPARLASFKSLYRADTDRYRSLTAAYRSEREWLFMRDCTTPDGFFTAIRQDMRAGCLSGELWDALLRATEEAGVGEGYRDRLLALRCICEGTGALYARIARRGAERRTAQALAMRTDLRVAALRGSVYRDPAWITKPLLDEPAVRDLTAVLRLREEQAHVDRRQRTLFEAYRTMYMAGGEYTLEELR